MSPAQQPHSQHFQPNGQRNRVFVNDAEDLDRIDTITNVSSYSDLQSVGSQHNLTGDDTNLRQTYSNFEIRQSIDYEAIELSSALDLQKRFCEHDRSSIIINTCCRGSTPTDVMRRWSQNISRFSKDKRAFRDQTFYRLPSRKVSEVDGKLFASFNAEQGEDEIEQLVGEIEQYECLMRDTALGEQNRLETLRALPQPLSTKRLMKRMLSMTIERQSISSDQCKNWHRHFFNAFIYIAIKCWKLIRIFFHAMEIWSGTLKIIEGNFGSNVSSYFRFLRWLFVLNIIIFACILGFIIVPQILFNVMLNNSNATNVNETEILQQLDVNFYSDLNEADNATEANANWKFLDFFTGKGYLENSLLFYGGYTNETFSISSSQSSYSLPHAYYMTILILYLSTFVVMSVSVARSYRKSFIATVGGLRGMHTQKLFCSWDYGITNQKAAELKHFTIFTEVKEWLSEIGNSKEKLSIYWRIWNFFVKIVAHMLVLALIAGVGVSIRILLEFFDSIEATSWNELSVAAAVNISLLFLQSVFSWIASLEDFRSPRHALHVTLIRNFILEAVVVAVLIQFWITKEYDWCWETSIGQEIYRFIISDFLINVVIMPVITTTRVFLMRRYSNVCDRPDFDIPQKSLGLVFNQTLLWIGLLFAPLLAAIVVLKMLLLFYVNKAMLFYVCKSPRHAWRSTQTQTLYLMFTFLSLLGIILILGYIMTQVAVSKNCGPFRDYALMFQILIDGVLKLRQHHKAWSFLMFLIRPAVIGGMLIVLAIMVYYIRAKSRARCLMVKMLKEMLILETKDKQFLLNTIANFQKNRERPTIDTHGVENSTRLPQVNQDSETNTLWRYKPINEQCYESSCSEQSSNILRVRNI